MASQIRSKQPRPLSIINESSLDDYAENYFQNESDDDAKEKHTQQKQVRKISVAPLVHPVIALSQDNLPLGEGGSQKDWTDCRVEGTSSGTIHGDNNDRKQHVPERLGCSGDSENCFQEPSETRQVSEIYTSSTRVQLTGNVLSSADITDQYIVVLNEKVNSDNGNKYSSTTDRETNSGLANRTYKDIRNDIRKSGYKSNDSNNSERCSNEQIQSFLKETLKGSKKWTEKCLEVMTVSKTVKNTNNSNVDSQQIDENETLNKEQQAWKTRVRKSSSFTSSSVKARPLRRSMGSYDFKNSSFLTRIERGSIKKGDSITTGNTSNQNVKFYLSSDDHEDQKDMVDSSHDSVYNSDDLEHPRELSFYKNNSWHRLYTASCDPIAEQSANLKKQSSFSRSKHLHSLPNLGKGLTNQQPQIKHNKSDGSLSYSPDSESSKRISDSQSNNLIVRRLSAVDQSDFRSLEALATRLNLPTRRLSTTIWREKYLKNVSLHQDSLVQGEHGEHGNDTKPCDLLDGDDDNKRLHDRVTLIREDLVKMRLQDQDLARQFLKIRRQMLEMRLDLECQNYMELLDGALEDVEEERELSRMVDIPSELLSPHYSLLHIGLTRMNLASRRFSAC